MKMYYRPFGLIVSKTLNYLAFQCFYLSVPDEGYYSNVPDEGYYSNVPDEGYYNNVPDEGYYSNVPDEGYYSNVPDEGYSRNVSCALNLISTFLLYTWFFSALNS